MDGSRSDFTEKEPVTDQRVQAFKQHSEAKKIEKRRSEPRLERETTNDGPSLLKACILEKVCKDGTSQASSLSVVGVPQDSSASVDLRSRSGGRTVEVCSSNLESSHSEVYSRESSSTTAKDEQSNTLTDTLTTTTESDQPNGSERQSNRQFTPNEDESMWTLRCRPPSMENMCRICHETDQIEPLISPCLCRGSLSVVHRTCLQHWLAESDTSSCELCRFLYLTKRVPKYSLFGSMVAWFRQNKRQRKALMVDTLGLIAFVPLATMITYVAAALAEGIEYQEMQPPSWADVTIRFAIVTFISLMTTIDVAYATYWMLRAQHHFSTWYSWYRRNSNVTLLPRSNQHS